MTAQAPDLVTIDGWKYALTAVEGDGPLHPAELGLEPRPMSTGCYRGFVATYAIVRDRLVLAELELGHDSQPPAIGGVMPTAVRDGFVWAYRNIAEPMKFTGRLLAGRHSIPNPPYLNMGFWPAWLYRKVHELHFEQGRQIRRIDRSAELAEVRAPSRCRWHTPGTRRIDQGLDQPHVFAHVRVQLAKRVNTFAQQRHRGLSGKLGLAVPKYVLEAWVKLSS